jgi:hypothetical protein
MGKSKRKNGSEVEFLRGKVRQLEAEVKFLKRQAHLTERLVDEATEDEPVEDLKVRHCGECGKGQITDLELSFLTISQCDTCNFRERKIK